MLAMSLGVGVEFMMGGNLFQGKITPYAINTPHDR